MIVYGQLFQEEEMGSISEPQPCDSQKESTLVTDLGPTIRNRLLIECATTNLIVLRFDETASELGWNAIEYFQTKETLHSMILPHLVWEVREIQPDSM
jgi:hypothetical protein